MRSQTKNCSKIVSEDNFMANKLYSATFFSKLILFIDNLENVIEKRDKSKFLIHRGWTTSDGTKIFCGKFPGPLWKILARRKLICKNLYPNPLLIHILYVCFQLINFHHIFLRRSHPIGNMGITTQFMSEYFSWELCKTRVKIRQFLLKIASNFVKNCLNYFKN